MEFQSITDYEFYKDKDFANILKFKKLISKHSEGKLDDINYLCNPILSSIPFSTKLYDKIKLKKKNRKKKYISDWL